MEQLTSHVLFIEGLMFALLAGAGWLTQVAIEAS